VHAKPGDIARRGLAKEIVKGTNGDQKALWESFRGPGGDDILAEAVGAAVNKRWIWTFGKVKLKARKTTRRLCPRCAAPLKWNLEWERTAMSRVEWDSLRRRSVRWADFYDGFITDPAQARAGPNVCGPPPA